MSFEEHKDDIEVIRKAEEEAKKLSEVFKTPVLYTNIKCKNCGKRIYIFYILNEENSEDFHVDIPTDDISTEI